LRLEFLAGLLELVSSSEDVLLRQVRHLILNVGVKAQANCFLLARQGQLPLQILGSNSVLRALLNFLLHLDNHVVCGLLDQVRGGNNLAQVHPVPFSIVVREGSIRSVSVVLRVNVLRVFQLLLCELSEALRVVQSVAVVPVCEA
jgi:hypothetical protein